MEGQVALLWKESASVSGWATTFTVWTRGGCCGICTFTSIHNSRVIISYQAPWPWFSYNLSIELEQNLACPQKLWDSTSVLPSPMQTIANIQEYAEFPPCLAGVIQVMAEPRSGSQGPSCRLCCSGGEPHRGTSALSACHCGRAVRTTFVWVKNPLAQNPLIYHGDLWCTMKFSFIFTMKCAKFAVSHNWSSQIPITLASLISPHSAPRLWKWPQQWSQTISFTIIFTMKSDEIDKFEVSHDFPWIVSKSSQIPIWIHLGHPCAGAM